MTKYAKIPLSHYSILINGLGTAQNAQEPTKPYYSKFLAFKETDNYTYVAADLTQAYPTTSIDPNGWLTPKPWVLLHRGAPLSFLQSVQRHILFVRKKYFVIHDEMAAASPAKFTILYPILEDNRFTLRTNTAAFSYASNVRKATGVDADAPDVLVEGQFLNDPASIDILDMTGTNVYSNPITGEDYDNSADALKYRRAHVLWVNSHEYVRKFQFTTVIYPVKPGGPAPTITRLDDLTVEVNSGPDHDVISFDDKTKFPATLIVDLTDMGLQNDSTLPDDFIGPRSLRVK